MKYDPGEKEALQEVLNTIAGPDCFGHLPSEPVGKQILINALRILFHKGGRAALKDSIGGGSRA